MNEVNKFFEGLPSQDKTEVDIFDEKPKEETAVAPEKVEDEAEGRKNRRHRRLEEQLQRERESNIALNERVKALSEVQRFQKSSDIEPLDSDLIRVFGETDNGKEIARIFEKKLEQEREKTKQETLDAIDAKQVKAAEEQKQYESVIDSELEALEDQYNVDLTSDAPKARKMRREFLEMVQKFSPKDENGTITDYADFDSTFEEFQSRQEKPDASRNKELAARSMQTSSASTEKVSDDATRAYLRSIGVRGI